jgi:hypothetical protein
MSLSQLCTRPLLAVFSTVTQQALYSLEGFGVAFVLVLVPGVQDRGQAVEVEVLQWRIQFGQLTDKSHVANLHRCTVYICDRFRCAK